MSGVRPLQDRLMPDTDLSPSAQITIRRWTDIADQRRLIPAIDTIFFEASGTKIFAGAADRAAFRERWLGRYLAQDPDWAFLAFDGDATVAGYLVGSIDDPAASDRFSDIGYVKDFRGLSARYPAHLHVNLAPHYRNHGIGAELIAAFAVDAARAGVPGMHVVTGVTSRNVRFYVRNGFHELARSRLNGHDVVMLGRRLGPAKTA
jgi:GNAT superfamily N-acetyltransferase